MKRLSRGVAVSAAIAATLLLCDSAARADGTCITRVTWQVRPCHAPEYFSKKQSRECKKAATASKVESRTLEVRSKNQCEREARQYGRTVRERIAGSSICKARPGQQIAMIWYGNFNGERVLDETGKNKQLAGGGVNRSATCPPEKKL